MSAPGRPWERIFSLRVLVLDCSPETPARASLGEGGERIAAVTEVGFLGGGEVLRATLRGSGAERLAKV